MRIGLDFDNTIAGYDSVFLGAARAQGLLDDAFCGGKRDVRDAIRLLPDGEMKWQQLQGKVYGSLMAHAEMIDGVAEFLTACRDLHLPVVVVSHKTEFGHYDPDKVNLRDAARSWMNENGFFSETGFGIPAENIYFEDDRDKKIARIYEIGCSHFVDDLEEVFLDPSFPEDIEAILFAGTSEIAPDGHFQTCRTWCEISDAILG